MNPIRHGEWGCFFEALSFLRIGFLYIRPSQQVIHTDVVEISQLIECSYRYIQSAQFVVGVGTLVNFQQLGQVFLF